MHLELSQNTISSSHKNTIFPNNEHLQVTAFVTLIRLYCYFRDFRLGVLTTGTVYNSIL